MDEYTEYEEQGWLSRIGDSIKNVVFGFAMIVLAFPCIFWNECRSVDRAKLLEQGQGAVVKGDANNPGKNKDGQLVHINGPVVLGDMPVDSIMGVSAKGLKLKRKVEVFQWVEVVKKTTKKKAGGKKVTKKSYSYKQEWKEKIIDSDSFKVKKAKYQNRRKKLPMKNEEFSAQKINIGKYVLTPSQASALGSAKKLPLKKEMIAKAPAKIQKLGKFNDGYLYMSPDPTQPRNGDWRLSYEIYEVTDGTVVGGKKGNGFTKFQTKKMKSALEVMVRKGKKSPKEMFEAAQADNAMLTWVIRIVSLLMLIGGFRAVFGPLEVFADVIPFIGSLVGGATTLVSILLGGGLWFLAVAVAWVVARPLIGILMLLVAGGLLGGMFFLANKNKGGAAAPPPGPPPM